MYIAHVFLFPALIAVLLTVHLPLVAMRHHTQFKQGRRETERKLVGVPLFPGQTPRSLGLLPRDRRGPRPARRPRPDQPDLAVGAVPHLRLDERRPARLVPRLADRRAATRAELRRHDRPLHARAEPVLGRRALPARRLRIPAHLAVARAAPHRRPRLPQSGRPPARCAASDGRRRRRCSHGCS